MRAGVLRDREADLYFRWERSDGRTIRGLGGRYRVLHPGRRNGGPGPDYLGATLTFPDGSVRRGDVEIHLLKDGWRRHKHQWDPRYRQVILHVIGAGPLETVPHGPRRQVPTVTLPRESGLPLPLCQADEQTFSGFGDQEEFLLTLARQRWWRRLADWNDRTAEGVRYALARRLGPDHLRLNLPGLWEAVLPEEDSLPGFLSRIAGALPTGENGQTRRGLYGRVMGLSALACRHYHTPARLWRYDLEDIQQLVRRMGAMGFPVPTRPFLVEVAGNWLLPLSSVETGADRFEEWYRLPAGWIYGRVKRHVRRLGLPLPATFGQQQGLLEWLETLCAPQECACCPVMGMDGGF